MMTRHRITIAILALGGQGGGVLADWILGLAAANGYRSQGTSVPGVAQRTGTTVYYIELFPEGGPEPVLALTPVPGDVDIVIASELMEAGRAILRGFVSDQTTLIASTHRIYAISEKSALGDGRRSGANILAAAEKRSARFIGFDMDAATTAADSMISAIMFGALAESGALPFPAAAFESSIRSGGKAVASNLRGFAAGIAGARASLADSALPAEPPVAASAATSQRGRDLVRRIETELPLPSRTIATEGVKRLIDYQDAHYADLYLDRLARIAALDDKGELTTETARYLALWMSYDDIIRVADLKTRASRFDRVRGDVMAQAGQIVTVTEYMHPRIEEVCEALPARLGGFILASPRLRRLLAPLFGKGRHVETTGLRWFLALTLLSNGRRFRRGTLRYHHEQARITAWLDLVEATAAADPPAARELAQCPRLIKGYSDTFVRGMANYERIIAWFTAHPGRRDAAAVVRQLREAALVDEKGTAFEAALATAGHAQ
jgi:indolepyruvate ferredoxin oxidoreductase beta subunit